MPQRMAAEEDKAFWLGLDLEMGGAAGARGSATRHMDRECRLVGILGAIASAGTRGSTLTAPGGGAK